MAKKAPFWTRPHLYLLVHAGSGVPYAVRVNMKKTIGLISLLSLAFLILLSGTLLFFRELEWNRQLQEKVLIYETQNKLAQNIQQAVVPVAGDVEEGETSPASAPGVRTPNNTTEEASREGARIADVNSRCPGEACTVTLSMVPTSTGGAQGQLLMILETEIPRIGSVNPSASVRKRFFVYPGYETWDRLSQKDLDNLKKQPFRFSRALRTTASFNIGKLLRPLAVNVYLFDKKGNALHHERRVIEQGN